MKKLSDCRVRLVDDAKTNLDILVEGLKSDHKLSLALDAENALPIEEVFAIMQSLPGVAVFKNVAELDRYLAVRQRSHEENG